MPGFVTNVSAVVTFVSAVVTFVIVIVRNVRRGQYSNVTTTVSL